MFKETERGAQCGWGQGPVYHHQAVSYTGTSLMVQWLRLCFPMQGAQVQSLVRELRSHMLNHVAKKKKKKGYTGVMKKSFIWLLFFKSW